MMEERKIKLATLALLTPIEEVLNDVVIPPALSDISEDDRTIIRKADELLKNGKPAVRDRIYLESIFNVLNGNNAKMFYQDRCLDDYTEDINYPVSQVDNNDQTEYRKTATKRINSILNEIVISNVWLSKFFEMLEPELTYMPGTLQDPDISLYDQSKLCAAFALCLLESQKNDEAFLLYSMDFSGIQDFIYTIQRKGALRTLRARSFYLEILMENAIDDILEGIGLSRINVLYSGGGHCYMLLPNGTKTIGKLEDYNKNLNNWLVDTFYISLFVGHGYAVCSADTLRNIPDGSYSDLFRKVSQMISSNKANRYDATQLLRLNNRKIEDHTRECNVCHRLGRLNNENECSICSAIKQFSNDILYNNYFVADDDPNGVPLPGKKYLKGYKSSVTDAANKCSYRKRVCENDGSYGLWIADYTSFKTLEEMADSARKKGCIDRIGIIRADVDNLGSTISTGFEKTVGGNIIRTSALSRQLTLFFKSHINQILCNPKFDLSKTSPKKERNATVCYAGGDDLFIIGEWDDIVGFAVDISKAFDRFTQGTLSISAGIGIYDSKYPISRIAFETAELEDMSKKLPGKSAVTLLNDGNYHSVNDSEGHSFNISDGTYTWKEFENEVIGDKYHEVSEFFGNSDARGMSFMYKLLELVRNQTERINFARFVYVLSRLEPGKEASAEEKARYKQFAEKMTKWIREDRDRRHLKTAMTLYAYMTRNEEEK